MLILLMIDKINIRNSYDILLSKETKDAARVDVE